MCDGPERKNLSRAALSIVAACLLVASCGREGAPATVAAVASSLSVWIVVEVGVGRRLTTQTQALPSYTDGHLALATLTGTIGAPSSKHFWPIQS